MHVFLVPILFHNLENYDAHLFVNALGFSEGDIHCIPKTDEKYISFSKKIFMETIVVDDKEKQLYLEMRFMDSYTFMSNSLDSLVNTLSKDDFKPLESQIEHPRLDLLRGDFLEHRAICAQKYRHPLRENEAFCCFCENGGGKIQFDELLAKYSSGK